MLADTRNVRNNTAKLVLKSLFHEQEENRLFISQELFDCVTTGPDFFRRVIIADQTWVLSRVQSRNKSADSEGPPGAQKRL